MRLTSEIPFLALVAVGAMLTGCQTLAAGGPSVSSGSIAGAQRAENAGEYVVAAERLKTLSRQAAVPDQQRLGIEVADDLLRGGQIAQAQKILEAIPAEGLGRALAAKRVVVEAKIEFARGHGRIASHLLAGLNEQQLSPELMAEAENLRAAILLKADHSVAAAAVLVRRQGLLVRRSALDANRQQIWSLLSQLSPSRLASAGAAASSPVLRGWISLAQIGEQTATGSVARQQALAAWSAQYPHHPASGSFLASLSTGAPSLPSRFKRIALLLPLTSQYSAAAQAVEDGFLGMAAVRPDPGHPQVKVYDIGADPTMARQFYRQAEKQGAQVIVGPLGLAASQDLIAKTALKVPTLLFIHTSAPIDAPNGQVYQFGLPARQEARRVAERAYVDGHRMAAVLYPDTPWGQRAATAFTRYWQKLGGTVNASQTYTPGLSQYGRPVERLLNIPQSLQRKQTLQNLLGTPLKFEARRRQDIDFVFLIADAQDGRLIKPQLDFHHADSLPVYSTSNIFTGAPDPVDDRDLDGIMFCDMPWMLIANGRVGRLRSELTSDQKYVNTPLDRLYALGVDAYSLLPHLAELQADRDATFHGMTAALSVDRGGVVHRQLVWAEFRKGLPHLLDHFLKYRGRFAQPKKGRAPALP